MAGSPFAAVPVTDPDDATQVPEATSPSSPAPSSNSSVTSSVIWGGRTYDSLDEAYARLMAWLAEKGLQPADVMWECYLNEPEPQHPEASETLVTWPLVG